MRELDWNDTTTWEGLKRPDAVGQWAEMKRAGFDGLESPRDLVAWAIGQRYVEFRNPTPKVSEDPMLIAAARLNAARASVAEAGRFEGERFALYHADHDELARAVEFVRLRKEGRCRKPSDYVPRVEDWLPERMNSPAWRTVGPAGLRWAWEEGFLEGMRQIAFSHDPGFTFGQFH
jgi:hypothetical protein